MSIENIHQQITDIFGNVSNKLTILQDEIDIQLQMEYFEYARKHKKIKKDDILKDKEQLFNPELIPEKKKELLISLASLNDISAYRTIEKYAAEQPDEELVDWSKLALNESRMQIESMLLDEKQIFISTGLGGKENKLRYFVVLINKEDKPFSDFQKSIIEKEFNFALKKQEAEIEEFNYIERFVTIVPIIPIYISIRNIFKEAVKECNQFGNFLMPNFIVTNVKKLTIEEINEFLSENEEIMND